MNTTIILVICAFILLILIIYYELQHNEQFTANNKNILIDMTELPNNQSIGDILNIPHIDLKKLTEDNIKNLSLLDGRVTGYEIIETKTGDKIYKLRTGNTTKKIDISSNEYINVKSSKTFIYKNSEKDMKDPSNIYISYPNKLPIDFISSQNSKKVSINQLNFNINNIGELVNKLSYECNKDKNCNGFYIALNDKNELIISNITDIIDISKLRDYPYTMNGDILTSILCIKQSQDQIDLANKMIGSCAKLKPQSTNIGIDCFAQLWNENKCVGPQPEYSDTFKALSYEELVIELKDSKCYTDPSWKQKISEKKEENKVEKKEETITTKLSNLFK